MTQFDIRISKVFFAISVAIIASCHRFETPPFGVLFVRRNTVRQTQFYTFTQDRRNDLNLI